MPQYKVLSATLQDEVDFGNGRMNQFVLDLQPVAGGDPLRQVNHWLQTGKAPFTEGQTVEGEIQNQPRGGVKLAKAHPVDGSGFAGSSPPAASAPSGGRTGSDSRNQSIEAQVRFKGFIDLKSAAVRAGAQVSNEQIIEAVKAGAQAFLPEAPQPAPSVSSPTTEPQQGNIYSEDVPF